MHEEHSRAWKAETEAAELGQEEKQRVTDPNAIGERGGGAVTKMRKEMRTDCEGGMQNVEGGSGGVTQDEGGTDVHGREGGRRTRGPGSKVREARQMPANQGLPEDEGKGSPARWREGKGGGWELGPERRRRTPVPAGARLP